VIAVGITLLKAPSMSRNAARENSLLRKPLSLLNTREWRVVSVDLPLRYACCASESRLGLMVSLIWMSVSLSRVFKKKEERLIGRKSFGLVWEGLPAFGIKITLTSSHLVGMWFRTRQPWKMAVSRGKGYS